MTVNLQRQIQRTKLLHEVRLVQVMYTYEGTYRFERHANAIADTTVLYNQPPKQISHKKPDTFILCTFAQVQEQRLSGSI